MTGYVDISVAREAETQNIINFKKCIQHLVKVLRKT